MLPGGTATGTWGVAETFSPCWCCPGLGLWGEGWLRAPSGHLAPRGAAAGHRCHPHPSVCPGPARAAPGDGSRQPVPQKSITLGCPVRPGRGAWGQTLARTGNNHPTGNDHPTGNANTAGQLSQEPGRALGKPQGPSSTVTAARGDNSEAAQGQPQGRGRRPGTAQGAPWQPEHVGAPPVPAGRGRAAAPSARVGTWELAAAPRPERWPSAGRGHGATPRKRKGKRARAAQARQASAAAHPHAQLRTLDLARAQAAPSTQHPAGTAAHGRCGMMPRPGIFIGPRHCCGTGMGANAAPPAPTAKVPGAPMTGAGPRGATMAPQHPAWSHGTCVGWVAAPGVPRDAAPRREGTGTVH